MKQKQKVIYYSDEVNDDFAGTKINKKKLPENYQFFCKGFFGKIRRGIIYYLVLRPLVFIYCKIIRLVSFKNKKATKGYKKQGCFIYGNHTAMMLDAFSPTYIAFPRPADVIVNVDAWSINGLSGIIKTAGGLPIPEGIHAMKRFNEAISEAVSKKHWIAIYPEAHIWHYYTKIRPFPSVSFAYPVKLNTPVFSYTMVYKKRKLTKHPKRKIYIDGPFFPDSTLPRKQAEQKLRDEVYAAMCERSKESNCEHIKYVYRPKEEEVQPENAVEEAAATQD